MNFLRLCFGMVFAFVYFMAVFLVSGGILIVGLFLAAALLLGLLGGCAGEG